MSCVIVSCVMSCDVCTVLKLCLEGVREGDLERVTFSVCGSMLVEIPAQVTTYLILFLFLLFFLFLLSSSWV